MSNQQILEQFYTAFANGDAHKMISFYDDSIQFEDPAFGKLKGERAKAMWKMLIERNTGNIKIECKNIKANDYSGSADWTAYYTFGPKKRNVVNHVKAKFEFKDGKIVKHKDTFDFKVWARQALGLSGWLFGGTQFFRTKVNTTTREQLDRFLQK